MSGHPYRNAEEKKEISQYALLIGSIFNAEYDGDEFLNKVISEFDAFQNFSYTPENKTFSNDVSYIIKCTTESLITPIADTRFQNRVEAYFCIYNRIQFFLGKKKQMGGVPQKDIADVNQLRKEFFGKLAAKFKSTNGAQPNLCTNNVDFLRTLNILNYLSFVTKIDGESIHLFFVLCKLSLQLPLKCHHQPTLHWKTILWQKSFEISLDNFISSYDTYREAFQNFPLDMEAFIYLIQILHPHKKDQSSRLLGYHTLADKLHLNQDEFFEKFVSVFRVGAIQNCYHYEEVAELIPVLSTRASILRNYLVMYYTNLPGSKDVIWNVFFHLSEKHIMNDIIQEQFTAVLSMQVQLLPVKTFLLIIQKTKNHFENIKTENFAYYTTIIETVFETLIKWLLNHEKHSTIVADTDWKALLKSSFVLSTTRVLPQPSSLLMIKRLLFQHDNLNLRRNSVDRIQTLFRILKDFDQDLNPKNALADMINDGWLQDVLIDFPEEFCTRLNHHAYRELCSTYQSNPWIDFIWSRITHLSIMKSITGSSNNMLLKLNKWMIDVKHDTFDVNDKLTIILIINLFENVIKRTNSVFSLPNIPCIIDFILHIRQEQIDGANIQDMDSFITSGQREIQDILLLNGKRSVYEALSTSLIVDYFLRTMNSEELLTYLTLPQWTFPRITAPIESILSISRPEDIDTTNIISSETCFRICIEKGCEWLKWFDRFFNVFEYPLEWFKDHKVDEAYGLFAEINTTKNNQTVTLIQMKTTAEKVLELLRPLDQLSRLCYLYNCLTSFKIIESGTTDGPGDREKFISDVKASHRNNKIDVAARAGTLEPIAINNRQYVHWFVASEKYNCNIKIEYTTSDGQYHLLFEKEKVIVHDKILEGEFETQRGGSLLICIDNTFGDHPRVIWFRIKSTDLSKCQLFNGIFDLCYHKFCQHSKQTLKVDHLNVLLNDAFKFIDELLDGTISVKKMIELKPVFCNKNIVVHDEVKNLFTNRLNIEIRDKRNVNEPINEAKNPTDQDIQEVCDRLQIYQYYSHINNIIDCIERFEILPENNDDKLFDNLKQLCDDESNDGDGIARVDKILQDQLKRLSSLHLQLIKTMLECSAVVNMMKTSNLYVNQERHRFQELRDNLTTQFQLQERNNMILNSLIVTYVLCEPFATKAETFAEFADRLAQLSNVDDNSLKHIKVINENIQMVNMWLSTEVTNVLDNALIIMEYLYKSGTVSVHLKRLMNEQSYYEIEYSVDKMQTQLLRMGSAEDDEENQDVKEKEQGQTEKIKFNLSMADVDDHKRQLTFCNIDLQQNMAHTKLLLNEQLKILRVIEKIYSVLVKLERSGHPNYQLKEEKYEIFDKASDINKILSELKKGQNVDERQLETAIQIQTKTLEPTYQILENKHNLWLTELEKSREECHLLKLFTNRQIMIMIILLAAPKSHNKIKRHFLEKLCSSTDINYSQETEVELTVQSLIHYLRSLRLNNYDLSKENLSRLYMLYNIESFNDGSDFLKKFCQFIQELFDDGKDLFPNNQISSENQQYFVALNSTRETTDKIPIDQNLDIKTCCILLNIFNNRLPSFYQILWCSTATEDDIRLFFSRIRTFHHLTFVVMDMDNMHHRLREQLLNEQNSLIQQQEAHGPVYYFSQETTTCQKGLIPFPLTREHQDPTKAHDLLMRLFEENNNKPPNIEIICGKPGVGKTHRINKHYKDPNTLCFSINDKLNLSLLTSSLISYDSKISNNNPSVYFNISIHAPFEKLTRALFSLLVCGSLVDPHSGFTFSLLPNKSWKFIIEIPFTNKYQMTIEQNLASILPILSIMSPSSIDEVTDDNYKLFTGEEEELVARFLKAYENGTINRVLTYSQDRKEEYPVIFDPLTDDEERRKYIYNCLTAYVNELPKEKVSQISFIKFLYRRVQFFVNSYYRMNETIKDLGSTVMRQMINEAKLLAQIDFQTSEYPRIFLVYDPNFALHILHDGWYKVPNDLKQIFNNSDPLCNEDFVKRDQYIKCLSWLIDIKYIEFERIMHETKFILTENFAYKIFHVHERKLTKLPLIIEGETGVGKTFLLKFYSLLLNSKTINGSFEDNIAPRIVERISLWLLKTVIVGILEKESNLLNTFLRSIQSKYVQNGKVETVDDNDDEHHIDQVEEHDESFILNDDQENERMDFTQNDNTNLPITTENQDLLQKTEMDDTKLLEEIKDSLKNFKYDKNVLRRMWKIILTVANQNSAVITQKLIYKLHEYITSQLVAFPLIEASFPLKRLLEETNSPRVQTYIKLFNEYLFFTQTKPLFYRLLLHPGVTEEQLEQFLSPISQLARQLPNVELVVFFDEINTSSCLGLFKEIFIDRTLHGIDIPKNIFFTGAINPAIKIENQASQVYRTDYLVHQLPESLEYLKVSYGILESKILSDYIKKKIATFKIESEIDSNKKMNLDLYTQNVLSRSILNAQEFCEKRLGKNVVSQREIQRCFNLIDFFWKMRYDDEDDEIEYDDNSRQIKLMRCIALSLALTYYFRLPTREDNLQRKDDKTPSREELGNLLSECIPDFAKTIQEELVRFVNTNNFVIPQGVAINQAIREHIFSIVVSIVTRTPLCIIGAPGQSKTLSFQIVLQNLQGPQLSTKPFCKRLPSIDPFFCLGSKYTRSEDIAYVFERAIKRDQNYRQNRIATQCVVFLDEASLPDENKMVLKVLHPYLDECKVAFVAVANKAFDAANANRMICIYRSLPSEHDQKILAYGCLGLQTNRNDPPVNKRLENIISGLCQGYREILKSSDIPHIFHDRDFIYMLRELRFQLQTTSADENIRLEGITPKSLLYALENNFNGITKNEFEKLTDVFFKAVQKNCRDFEQPSKKEQNNYRNVPTIFRNSIGLDSARRRLYGRYKLIIDESEDESAVRLLFQTGILDSNPNQTTVFRMSDFPEDIDNELRNVEILSTMKLCMETGKTILMVNTGRIHGALYDVFNQNFSIMATGDTRKIFSKVAIGPKTVDVVVHEDFQCIVHIKRSEFGDIPPPFLSRFQKYSFSINDFYRIECEYLPEKERRIMKNVEEKVQSFIQHFERQYFYGLNHDTLYSCLLSLIKIDENQQRYLANIHQHYSQLTIHSKSFIEQNPSDVQQCLLRFVLSKLIQLVSPESMILKLPTLENKISRLICKNYFQQQEHFNIENFINQLISNPLVYDDDNILNDLENLTLPKSQQVIMTTKVIIFTRTSSFIMGLTAQTKKQLFDVEDDREDNVALDPLNRKLVNISEKIDILNIGTIDSSVELQENFHAYEQNNQTQILLIVIDARIKQQYLHIPLIRQMVDKSEHSYNSMNQTSQKHYLILIHSPAQEIYHRSCFPTIFLYDWDFYFFDICTRSSAFHLQKMIEVVSSSFEEEQQQQRESSGDVLYDLNTLFDDCLWDFCSRIQIFLQELPHMFNNTASLEFYQRGTSIMKRVQCLKQILQQYIQLQKYIVSLYHKYLITKKNSAYTIYNLIYQISKDIVCGKRFDGLVDSIRYQIRIPFISFVSNILKFIVNDYGLESLLNMKHSPNDFDLILNLIDYSLFTINDDSDVLSSTAIQGTFQVNIHYSFIPETLFFYLFYQRIRSHIDEIKSNLVQKDNEAKDQKAEIIDCTSELFRRKLINSMINDAVLSKILSQSIFNSYLNDLIRITCSIVDKSFSNNNDQNKKSVEFISQWLLLLDDNDSNSFKVCPKEYIWRLAHVHTLLEYEQDDLLSVYTACRIIDRLEQIQTSTSNELKENQLLHCIKSLKENDLTRSKALKKLFGFMFNHLWNNLCRICLNNDDSHQWIHTYNFISTYYPSNKILNNILVKNKERTQVEFMNLAYLIYLNEKTPEPNKLINSLLNQTNLINADDDENSDCHEMLPDIIKSIQKYFEDEKFDVSTLIIDLSQWIVSTLKMSIETCREKICFLLKYLNQSTCPLSLSMKQFLFDELMNLSLDNIQYEQKQQDIQEEQNKNDCIDLIKLLLPRIIECISVQEIDQNYRLPYHPSAVSSKNLPAQHQMLLDLFFFYLKRHSTDEIITCNLINKLLVPVDLSKIKDKNHKTIVQNYFKQLKEYFSIEWTAILMYKTDSNEKDPDTFTDIIKTIINDYLLFDPQTTQFSPNLQLFLSIIISKRSWNHLLSLLQSDHIQNCNKQWANDLYKLLQREQILQDAKHLEQCHQIQFTLSTKDSLSVFPTLHQPYHKLSELIDKCVKENLQDQKWKLLSDWIESKKVADPRDLTLKEIRVMILLKIYYNYYCNNQLALLDTLLELIENILEPSPEELIVFRAFLQPEKYMIGYPNENKQDDDNFLNKLFKLDCNDEDELGIRHLLVNLLAMILMGGEQSFLWTFVFKPLTLDKTYGFGSTAKDPILENGVHYDCGCVLSVNGDLVRFSAKEITTTLDVPAVYVAYFLTFGGMAWHLLLYDASVANLHGPILAKHAVGATDVDVRIAGESERTKVCHFVRARILSTFSFLSIRFNQNDACILLSRCFEKMAFLTMNYNKEEGSWIKPYYKELTDQHNAEKEYQSRIFYPVLEQLPDHQSYINDLYLTKELQTNLQNFISQMPINIQFVHFKTELNNPIHSHMSLNILQRTLNSPDFFKMTKYIYDLSKFYVLLHQTYTKLIERDQFFEVTLQDLQQRGEKHYKNTHRLSLLKENTPHEFIIKNGIEAVNAYHEFADGLIRPGACDRTESFMSITNDTPVSYLVTTENHNEGDIVRRILSVLADYHNKLLDLLDAQMKCEDNNSFQPIRKLVDELSSKEVSILQIMDNDAGVITLNDQDYFYIEKLCRASLISKEEYFPTLNTSTTFDFSYVQSYIIRKHFLRCRIDYQHITQKYQCYVRRTPGKTLATDGMETFDLDEKYTVALSNEQLETDWNHLKEIPLDKLYHGYSLFRQIIFMLKDQKNDRSTDDLYEFIGSIDDNNDLRQQLEQYEVKNFKLCYIDHVRKLYETSIRGFEHLFTDVSPLLRVPIKTELNSQLTKVLEISLVNADYDNKIEKINETIRSITDLLNDLKTIENTLLQQSIQSLTSTCKFMSIENPILALIAENIKCENYVPLNIHLIKIRSTLQERIININEKEIKIWHEDFSPNTQWRTDQQQNCFQNYLNVENGITSVEQQDNINEESRWDFLQMNADYSNYDDITENDLLHEEAKLIQPNQDFETTDFENVPEYSTLLQLVIKVVPLTTSTFIQRIHDDQQKTEEIEPISLAKAPIFSVTYPDGKTIAHLWKGEKLYEQLRKVFKDKKYDPDTFAVVDKDQIFMDFLNTNSKLPRRMMLEYKIIEKTLLVQIEFQFQKEKFEYFATSDTNISTVIDRLISDKDLQPKSPEIYFIFSDEFGKCINGKTLADISANKLIKIIITEATADNNTLCEVTVHLNEGQEKTEFFDPLTTWQQVNDWLKTMPELINTSADSFAFVEKEQKTIVDENRSISSSINSTTSTTFDGISRNDTTQVILSFESHNQSICALNSISINRLLHNKFLLQQLHVNIPPAECVLVLEDSEKQLSTMIDTRKELSEYSTADNQPIRIRISTLIEILKNDDQQRLKIPISNRSTTIEQILQLTNMSVDIYKYLASNNTKCIISNNEYISNLNETKFVLLKENETCIVSIKMSNELQLIEINDENDQNQRFMISATISDIYKQNKIDTEQRFLLYADDFVPSLNTPVTSFLTTSPVKFTVIGNNLPITVTIINDENSIKFNCSNSMKVKRLFLITCQLFNVKIDYYQLTYSDCEMDDGDVTLEDIDSSIIDIEFKLVCKATLNASIKYLDQTLAFPCIEETELLDIVKEIFIKLHIPQEDIDMYELVALDDRNTQLEFDTTMEDVIGLFSSDIKIVPFELKKKEDDT